MTNAYELLAPAGDLERLDTALRFGADAVYLGGPMLQLRSGHVGFDMDGLAEAVRRAHAAGKKLYVTVNAFADNRDIEAAHDYAQALEALGIDAVIVSDLGLIRTIRRAAQRLPVHVSTQANCLNYASALTYYDLGATRVVLGREMALDDIAELCSRLPAGMEIEAFVHGAMCMAYSGRCLISAYLTGRSGNKGGCAQSCRWNYHLEEEKRPGEFFPIEEDERGTTILSSFDLCCIDFLDRLMEAGVTSFKIEGRMKSPFYVATVVNAYRKRLDSLLQGEKDPAQLELLHRELNAASHRPYCTGFYFGEAKRHAPDDGVYLQDTRFTAAVRSVADGRVTVELRNRFFEGDRLELLSPKSLGETVVVRELRDDGGAPVREANVPGRLYSFACELDAEPGDLLRMRIC